MFQVGDLITVNEPRIDVTVGTVYKITVVDDDGTLTFQDDIHDPHTVDPDDVTKVIVVPAPTKDMTPTDAYIAGYTLGVLERTRVQDEAVAEANERAERAFKILNDIQRLLERGRR